MVHLVGDRGEIVPEPSRGRVFEGSRRVRLGDVSPAGRLRLDALVRYLQDVSNDDTRDAGMPDDVTWVVRRILVSVEHFPVLGEDLTLRTFCGGTGPRWAERRVSVRGERGGLIEAVTLWVHVDRDGRPAPLPAGFMDLFGEAAGGRRVSARLHHAEAPPVGPATAWPLRFTDFDVLGHVNNAAYWAPVEECLAIRRHLRAPLTAELEYRGGLEVGATASLRVADGEHGGLAIWICDGDDVAATVRVGSSAGGRA
jgi:acyl-ACP thioesterase